MSVTDAEAGEFVRAYLDAFSSRNLDQCVSFYQSNAGMTFGPVHIQGMNELTRWHQARFAANASVVQIDEVSVDNDVIRVQGKMTSKRLKTWRIHTISGVGEFTVKDGKVSEVRFRMTPLSVVPSASI